MSGKIDPKQIETNAYKSYYQDGLMEILLGVYLIFVGGLLFTESKLVPFTVFVIFGLKPAYEALKNRFTYPRIGFVEFPVDEGAGKGILKGLLIFFLLGGGAVVILTLLLGGDRGWELWLYRVVPAMVGVLLAMGPIYAAGTYGLKHWYLIAALFVVSGFAAPLLGYNNVYVTIGFQISVVGLVALSMGILMLVNFMRIHPVLEQEINHAGG